MSKSSLFIVNPTVAAEKARGILQKHVQSLAKYVATNRIERAGSNSSSLLNTENFVYKVLIPTALLYVGQEQILQFMPDSETVNTMRNMVAEQGYVNGIIQYVKDFAFQHSNPVRNTQDITLAGLVAALVTKVAKYGFDKSVMKLPDVSNEAFKQIAADIYYRYSELVEYPQLSELAAFKLAFEESSEEIENLSLDKEQKQRLLAIISNRLTPAVAFHKELDAPTYSR